MAIRERAGEATLRRCRPICRYGQYMRYSPRDEYVGGRTGEYNTSAYRRYIRRCGFLRKVRVVPPVIASNNVSSACVSRHASNEACCLPRILHDYCCLVMLIIPLPPGCHAAIRHQRGHIATPSLSQQNARVVWGGPLLQ